MSQKRLMLKKLTKKIIYKGEVLEYKLQLDYTNPME